MVDYKADLAIVVKCHRDSLWPFALGIGDNNDILDAGVLG